MTGISKRLCSRLRHMRHRPLEDLYWSLLYRLTRPTIDLRPAPSLRPTQASWISPAQRAQTLIGPNRVRFLHLEAEIRNAAAWNDPTRHRRWLYDLHNFHFLNALHWQAALHWHAPLICRWIEQNPPATGVGWEPYPVSQRVVNWIKWALAGNQLPAEVIDSLAIQTRLLASRLERHIPGNHLLANAKALMFAGLFFDGDEATRWYAEGVGLLAQEIRRQILSDGGQYELSPMYHSIVLEDFLDLTNMARVYGAGASVRCTDAIEPMRRWLRLMCHPDGDIALFNDAAIGIAPSPAELEAYARRLGFEADAGESRRLIHLSDSGFVRLKRGVAVALLDVGTVGADRLPAHGHADTLTFEMSLFGQRVVVDSGVSRYDDHPERRRQRGTAAHNTVVVDGQDSSEMFDDFRVGRRARIISVSAADSEALSSVRASHDGYRRFPGKVTHKRTWEMSDSELVIIDEIGGTGRHDVEVMLHFHPDVRVERLGDARFSLLVGPTDSVVLEIDRQSESRLQPSTYHPQFGLSLPAQVAISRWSGTLPVKLRTTLRYERS